jgi:hypothetical protein
MKLITKIQHKNFEAGEFVEIKERTYEETIGCIDNFPWEKERDHIQIGLTNPSLTIESDIDNFLKLALFYNGKFVLHFFSEEQELYTKSFFQKEDAYPYIKNLYESEVFDLHDFKKEPTWMQHNLVHFVTQDFHYTITPKRIRQYLLNTSGINFLGTFFLTGFILFQSGKGLTGLPLLGLLFFYFILFGGGLNLVIFFNYYLFAKNKTLIMSKGNDEFYFGEKNNPERFNKKDISLVTIYSPSTYRNPLNGFSVIKIEFTNHVPIRIPNLFVSELALKDKLYQQPQVNKLGLKLVKR